MRALAIFIICTLIIHNFSFAQKEAYHWEFGFYGSLDFSSGVPVYGSGASLYTNEGFSSISDSAGNLLFYTDGITVINRNNVAMVNGTGLMGNGDATQSA